MRQTLIEAHVPFPEFNAVFVSAVEFVCGLLLVLGALTPLACALLAFVMLMGHYDDRDAKYQSDMSARLGLGILVSSRGALTCDPCCGFSSLAQAGSASIT
jgi:hypothetical protein